MQQWVEIHFWAEGDDPSIPTLHEELSTPLQRHTRPFVKGRTMANGEPAPVNFTMLAIAEDMYDDFANPKANTVVQEWLKKHQTRLKALKCDTMGISVSIILMGSIAYEGFKFSVATVRAAADVGCGLTVVAYRALESSCRAR